MITETYCREILEQYPEYITKDQMYRICHISKKTCLFLLESGLVPSIDSGKKIHRSKIKTMDVIQYLRDRDDYPELYKAPDENLMRKSESCVKRYIGNRIKTLKPACCYRQVGLNLGSLYCLCIVGLGKINYNGI